MSWDHFLLRFTGMFNGVGGTMVLNMLEIWSVVPIMFICCAYSFGLGVCFCGVCTRLGCPCFLYGVRFVTLVVLWVHRM